MNSSARERFPIFHLVALTIAAFFLHGYHLGVEDGEIYIPAVKKLIDPALYSFGSEFFLSHGHLSLFAPLLATTARLTHLPTDWTILAWYVICLFGMIAASWMLAAACFQAARARWCSVLILVAALTMPAANTALLLMDPYMTARSFSTPLTIFALAALVERRYARAGVAVLLTAAFHPQMAVYLVFLACIMLLAERYIHSDRAVPSLAAVSLLPGAFRLAPASGAYQEALYSRDYFFLYNWSWYHWLGMLGPLAFLVWFSSSRLRGTRPGFARLSFVMIPFGLLSLAAGAVLSSSPRFEMFVRLQPLRTFHLITIVFLLLLGGVIGEYAAHRRLWVLPAIALPLAAGMFFVDHETYPHSHQIEWPSATSSNSWVNTMLWIRQNTPQDAVFAVDSRYFLDAGVDNHGFRSISERSALADYYKDSGVVSLFPALADEWKQMSNATYGLNHFQRQDFVALREKYPDVSWTVVHGSAPKGLNCPYEQRGYAVCLLPLHHRSGF